MKNRYKISYNNSRIYSEGTTDLSMKELIKWINEEKDFFEFVEDQMIVNKNNINFIEMWPNVSEQLQ